MRRKPAVGPFVTVVRHTIQGTIPASCAAAIWRPVYCLPGFLASLTAVVRYALCGSGELWVDVSHEDAEVRINLSSRRVCRLAFLSIWLQACKILKCQILSI